MCPCYALCLKTKHVALTGSLAIFFLFASSTVIEFWLVANCKFFFFLTKHINIFNLSCVQIRRVWKNEQCFFRQKYVCRQQLLLAPLYKLKQCVVQCFLFFNFESAVHVQIIKVHVLHKNRITAREILRGEKKLDDSAI